MSEGQVQYVKNNFSAGETSPLFTARLDLEKYNQSLGTAENIILLPQGGFTSTWGTQFVAEVKDSLRVTRLEDFRFSTEQAYMLEFGHGYIRFFRNQGQIGGVITNADDSGGLVRITAANHGLATSDTVYISGVQGATEANGFWSVTVVDANRFTLDGSVYTTEYAGGGTWVVEIASPYLEGDLFDLQFTQSADVLYITHESYAPRQLIRASHTRWVLQVIPFIGGPFRPKDPSVTTTISPSATTGNITLTASASLFQSLHVGAFWELTHGSTTGYVTITGFNSATSVNATVKKTLGGTTATAVWREGMWSAVRGYPRAVMIDDERLVLGGSPDDPATFVGSVVGKFDDLTVGVNDDDAYQYTIGANEVCSILWLAPGDPALIGTPSGVFKVFGSGTNAAITPTSVTVRLQTSVPAAPISPVTIESELFYLQSSLKKLRRLQYDFETDKLIAEDTTVLSSHILSPGCIQMAYQAEPYDLLWIVRNDGQLVTMTTLEQQKIRGFARRRPAGIEGTAFESIAGIPSPDGTFDQPWVIVKRRVNGVWKKYIEFMTITDPLNPDAHAYLESALTYNGAPTTSVTGLSHLESESVGIIGDNKRYVGDFVLSGTVELQGSAASRVTVGIPFTPLVTTNSPEVNLADGPSFGRRKKLSNVKIWFVKTTGGSVSSPATLQGEELAFVNVGDSADIAPPLFTGAKTFSQTSWEDDGRLTFIQPYSLPFTVLAMSGKLTVGDL